MDIVVIWLSISYLFINLRIVNYNIRLIQSDDAPKPKTTIIKSKTSINADTVASNNLILAGKDMYSIDGVATLEKTINIHSIFSRYNTIVKLGNNT